MTCPRCQYSGTIPEGEENAGETCPQCDGHGLLCSRCHCPSETDLCRECHEKEQAEDAEEEALHEEVFPRDEHEAQSLEKFQPPTPHTCQNPDSEFCMACAEEAGAMPEPESALAAVADTMPEEKALPVPGEWYWIEFDAWPSQGHPEPYRKLYCCAHLGSNHAKFENVQNQWRYTEKVMYRDWHRWHHEPNWREHFQAEIDRLQIEMRETVAALAGDFAAANLAAQQDDTAGALPTMAIVANARPVEQQKAELLALKNETIPTAEKDLKALTEQMVGTHKNLFLPELLMAERFTSAAKAIEEKLFALELYAGFGESIHMIQDGRPADPMAPIHVHQMLRYMDEETLISAVEGGMDFSDLDAFDEWACQNIDAITPHPRAVVAWKVRRHGKDYGPCRSLWQAFQHLRWHEANMETYLLIRNGSKIYRAATALDFTPRMIPFRGQFSKDLTKKRSWYDGKEPVEIITPQHVEYDDKVAERSNQIRHYNRILFLLQGVLDRSDVFKPHPPVDLSSEQGAGWLIPVRDEEDGLPASVKIKFEDYREAANQPLKKGDTVYAEFDFYHQPRSWRERGEERSASGLFRFEGWTNHPKKGRLAKVSKGGNKRHGYQFPSNQWNKGPWGEWPTSRTHYTCAPEEMFRLASYTPGDYKRFLCDSHMKGEYLKWAPQLVTAEKWHRNGKPELPP